MTEKLLCWCRGCQQEVEIVERPDTETYAEETGDLEKAHFYLYVDHLVRDQTHQCEMSHRNPDLYSFATEPCNNGFGPTSEDQLYGDDPPDEDESNEGPMWRDNSLQ